MAGSLDSEDGMPSRSSAVFVVTTITMSVATVFVIARLVSRFVVLKVRSWDDYLMILGWVR